MNYNIRVHIVTSWRRIWIQVNGDAQKIALLSQKCALLEEELAAERNTIMILTDIADAKWRLASSYSPSRSSDSPRTQSYAPSPKHPPPPLMETPRMGDMLVAAPSVKSQEDRKKQAVADVSGTGTSDPSMLSILRVSPPGGTAEYDSNDGVFFNDRQYSELDVTGAKISSNHVAPTSLDENVDRLRAENEDGAVGDALTQELNAAQNEILRLNKEKKNGEKNTPPNIPATASAPDIRGGPTQKEAAAPAAASAAPDIRGGPTQKEVDDLKRALAEAQQFINDEMDKKDMLDKEDVKETLGEVPLTKELGETDADKTNALPPTPTAPPIPPPLTQNELDGLKQALAEALKDKEDLRMQCESEKDLLLRLQLVEEHAEQKASLAQTLNPKP